MDTGPFFSGTISIPSTPQRPQRFVHKGLCIRVGENSEAAVCYDTELLSMSCGWTGPFLNIDGARYGLIVPPHIAGPTVFTTPSMPGWSNEGKFADRRANKPYGPLPREHARYDGLYLNGSRVVLAYTVGTTRILETPWSETVDGVPLITRTFEIPAHDKPLDVALCGTEGTAAVVACIVNRPAGNRARATLSKKQVHCQLRTGDVNSLHLPPNHEPLLVKVAIGSAMHSARMANLASRAQPVNEVESMTHSDQPRWTATIETRGEIGSDAGPLAVDTVTIPYDNPYRALMFISGHDFLSNGDAAVSTAHGDVWLVRGLDQGLQRIQWRRFATGLFQPLGLKVVRDTIYVVGRDQITRLHDRNADGEADWYENFNNDGEVSTNGHEYVTCLETDSAGNFYYLKGDSGSRTRHDGCVLRVSPDGRRLEVFATGLRNANGLGIGPNNEITAAPQEGEWTPASGIFSIRQGGFYGAMQVHHRATPPTDFDRPICWLPRRIDNSSGGQAWVPEGSWGPLAGQLLHFSYGQCTMMVVLRERLEGALQGAAVPLPVKFLSGAMRGRFNPHDGHLYVSGLRGWVTSSVTDGCLQRVRYTGKPLGIPVQMRSYSNGLALTFSEPLVAGVADNPDLYQVEHWDYRWSAQYGSPELRPSQPNVEGREPLYVESASLLEDGRTVFLEIAGLRPAWQISVQYRLPNEQGQGELKSLYGTLHVVPDHVMDVEPLNRRRGAGFLTQEQRDELAPGLIARFQQNQQGKVVSDTMRLRLPALSVEPGTSPSLFSESAPFRASIEGYLRPAEPGEYQFRVEGRGVAKVFLNETLVAVMTADSQSNPAEKDVSDGNYAVNGYVRLRIEYESGDATQRNWLRVLWRGPSGIEEVVAPTALWSHANDSELLAAVRKRAGHDAMASYRCAKCHDVDSVAQDAPSLSNARKRFNPEWLGRWLLAPREMRADATMPQLLENSTSEMARQQAADLSAFLMTLETSNSDEPDPMIDMPESDLSKFVARGESLFEDLGCIACHRLTEPATEDEWDRISLAYVAAKYPAEALAKYLMEPHHHDRYSEMPDFHLTRQEAIELTAFLQSKLVPLSDGLEFPQGSAAAGEDLFKKLGCANCHDMGQQTDRSVFRRGPTPIANRDAPGKGCLDPNHRNPKAPRFDLSDERLAAINEAITSDTRPATASSSEQATRHFQSLRCFACHSRDGQPSILPVVMAEEGARGVLPESLPDLTWSGERLKESWMRDFIAGKQPYRPRPHLRARMPAFPEHASVLAHGFATEHAVQDTPRKNLSSVSGDFSSMATGYRLTLKDGGLDCRQCHGIGNQQPIGDDQTRIAPGINFVHARERLRYDFYRRFVLDPPRYDLSTKMPKLSPDGRTTNVQRFYGGDAVRQFDSIWHYIQTIRGDEP